MSNFFINKDNKTGEIVYLEYDKNGYSVFPKAKKKDDIEVNKIVFVSPELTNKLIKKKLDIKINKMLDEYNDNDDDGNNGTNIRDRIKEAERLKLNILQKYGKYLSNSYTRLTVRKLQIIIDGYRQRLYKLRKKQEREIILKAFMETEEKKEKKGKGR